MPSECLIFGASGAIGSALISRFQTLGWSVTGVARSAQAKTETPALKWLRWSPEEGEECLAQKTQGQSFSALIWAQGMNGNDTVFTYDKATHLKMYEANVLYILDSLKALLSAGRVEKGAKLCIISSIWQEIARQNKLSYCVTKSALQGLLRSLAVDLGKEGMLVNTVLPGPLDTPMTRANLSPEQLARLQAATPLSSLPTLEDVCALTAFLCSPENTGLTGQFMAADRGYSHVRYV